MMGQEKLTYEGEEKEHSKRRDHLCKGRDSGKGVGCLRLCKEASVANA